MNTAETWRQLCPDSFACADTLAGGAGFFLADDRVRYIESGSVNVFIGCFDPPTGQPLGTHLLVAGLDAGQLLFPMPVNLDKDDRRYRLLAIPLPGTVLRQSRAAWQELVRQDAHAQQGFEQYASQLLTPFAREMPPPRTRVITWSDLDGKRHFQYPAQTDFRPGQGLLWVKLEDGYCVLNGDEEEMLLAPGVEFPLAPQMWLHTLEPVAISCRTTAEWLAAGDFPAACEAVFRQFMRAVLVAVAYRNQRRQWRQRRLLEHEQAAMQSVAARLRRLMQGPRERPAPTTALSASHAVIQRVARACATTVELPPAPADDTGGAAPAITELLEQCNLFYRKITLGPRWWREEGMPAIAFRKEDGQPVAVFHEQGQYHCYDPAAGTEAPLNAETAGHLDPTAISVYARLPARPLQLRDVMALAGLHLKTDFRAAFVIGLIGGLVALAPARVTSTLFNTIIPTADYFQLVQMGLILFGAACTGTLFELSRSLLMLRIKTRANYQLQAAVWGRLLNLPAGFFGEYAAGDLAQRVMGVDAIRAMLADNVSQAAMALIFALPNLGLMLYYSGVLTGVGLLAMLAYVVVLMAIGYANYGNQGEEFRHNGELSGFTLQAITGIAKIRMSISENRAFARWAEMFSERIKWKSRVINNQNLLAVLGALFPPLMTGIFFLVIGSQWKDTRLNTGNYLAFNAAFSSMAVAFTGFASIIPSLLATVALYKRLTPVLAAAPEIADMQKPAGEIDGHVEIRNVTYRYRPELPLVLKGVNLSAQPGEFVAIVGPSGAGKSTIARLLLGLDTPEAGGVYYGGIDLAAVNRREVRKQIGTVLQGGGLLHASIYDNIAGVSGMSLEDAWEAARLAGCDADIRAMPMGMHTLVFNGAVSGGQRQRLLIARALARNPRVILFDEATSALDNEAQALVSDSLDRLNATRVVIAHRLSTIMRADRIYVLEAGQVVQTGTFEELLNQPGLFQRLARRQML